MPYLSSPLRALYFPLPSIHSFLSLSLHLDIRLPPLPPGLTSYFFAYLPILLPPRLRTPHSLIAA